MSYHLFTNGGLLLCFDETRDIEVTLFGAAASNTLPHHYTRRFIL